MDEMREIGKKAQIEERIKEITERKGTDTATEEINRGD